MSFDKIAPRWDAAGVEPSEEMKQSGFQPGYKPPAAYFNWFFNSVFACLSEIHNKLSNVDNTADKDKVVKSAGKVSNAITVKLNNGSSEDMNKFTFDGSASKTVNVTPESIGGAKKDLSNVDNTTVYSKVTSAGITGVPVVNASTSDGTSYSATVTGVSSLTNGLTVTIIPSSANTSTAPTLNINGLGAASIRLPLSINNASTTTVPVSFMTENRPITLQYSGTDGSWKVTSKQKTSASDLYGSVPVSGGGTGASTASEARANLEITPANIGAADASHSHTLDTLSNVTICDALPADIINGQWYLVKE